MDVLSKVGIWFAVGVPTLIFMEVWAAVLHGKLWHGPMWSVHESHHRREGWRGESAANPGRWERNDALSFTHAPIAMALIFYGCLATPGMMREVCFGIGIGMTVFGAAYVVVHDGLCHERMPVQGLARYPWLRRVRDAHGVHHRTGGAPNGLFFGPWVIRRESLKRKAARQRRSAAPRGPAAG